MESPGVSCYDFAYPTGSCRKLSQGQMETESSGRQRRIIKSIKGRKQKTYLLSAPTEESLLGHYTSGAISTLLRNPHTDLILLVPPSHILHPFVCNLGRLPKAGGSCVQVLPCDFSRPESGFEVVGKLRKNCKVSDVDGCLAFDEEKESRAFLLQIVSCLRQANARQW